MITGVLNVDRKTPVRFGRLRKTGAERTSQWTSSSTWESPASYPVTSPAFAAKRETPLTRETRTLRCGPHSRVSADKVQDHHEKLHVFVSWCSFMWWCNAVRNPKVTCISLWSHRHTHPLWVSAFIRLSCMYSILEYIHVWVEVVGQWPFELQHLSWTTSSQKWT